MATNAAIPKPSAILENAARVRVRSASGLETTSKTNAEGSRADGKCTNGGWLGCPNGLPWTTSFNVQRPATTGLWLQMLPVVMADLLEPGMRGYASSTRFDYVFVLD